MKNSIIAQLIAGLIGKSPTRINYFKWIVGILTAIAAFLTYAGANHLFPVPDAFSNAVAWAIGIAAAIGSIIGAQLAKKDINEGK